MNLTYYRDRLSHQAETIARLTEGIDTTQARWRPTPEDWSLLEVVNHLYDEETEDFRIRLQLTLNDPLGAWPPNDPEQKVIARDYNSRELGASLENFLDERTVSLEWLRGLEGAEWNRAHRRPDNSALSAGDLLVSWVAHDLLHIRQLTELHFQYQRNLAQPYTVDYAGDW